MTQQRVASQLQLAKRTFSASVQRTRWRSCRPQIRTLRADALGEHLQDLKLFSQI